MTVCGGVIYNILMPDIYTTEFHIASLSVMTVLAVFNTVALVVCSAAQGKRGVFTRIALALDIAELAACLSVIVIFCLCAIGEGKVIVNDDFLFFIGDELVSVAVISDLLFSIARYPLFAATASVLLTTAVILPLMIAVTGKRVKNMPASGALAAPAPDECAATCMTKEEDCVGPCLAEEKSDGTQDSPGSCVQACETADKRTVVLGGKTIVKGDAAGAYERYLEEKHK